MTTTHRKPNPTTLPDSPTAPARVIHFKDMQQLLDRAHEYGQTVNVRAWEGQTGNAILYEGWLVSSSNWRRGWHKLVNPRNHQIRTIPDIYVYEVNSMRVYL